MPPSSQRQACRPDYGPRMPPIEPIPAIERIDWLTTTPVIAARPRVVRDTTGAMAPRTRSTAHDHRTTDSPPDAHRSRPPDRRRPGPRPALLPRRAGLRGDAALRRQRRLPVGRRLPSSHRPEHLERPRARRRRRPARPASTTWRSSTRRGWSWRGRSSGCSTTASASTAPPTTASARRSTCATRTATAWRSTATARPRSGRARAANWRWYTRRLDLDGLLAELDAPAPAATTS